MMMQHLYEALKTVRATGEAWLSWNGRRLKLRVSKGHEEPEGVPFEAFVRARGVPGGVKLAVVWWHDGRCRVGTSRWTNDRNVLAIVAQAFFAGAKP